jgi:peptide chain release factor 2
LTNWRRKSLIFGGIFDYGEKAQQLEEITRELADPGVWSDAKRAQDLGQTRSALESIVNGIDSLDERLQAARELAEMLNEDPDADLAAELESEVDDIKVSVDELEFQRMFTDKLDPNNAYVDIQSGSGGTEAQDWAEMLLRMYLRWCDQHGFKATLMECSSGDVAGIKSATIAVAGDHAYGWLRGETGVHRLVRKSPFDSGNRRHTSFASVFVAPEISDDIEIEINPADLRIDTYRASGAGGQHVNKTESAVRITHLPTNLVVQCQNDRSQHKNKAQAMKQLQAKLYELERSQQLAEQQELEASKSDIGWGSQIRSYVLDDARIKDIRTGVENRNTQAVLDGDLDQFIIAYLKQAD